MAALGNALGDDVLRDAFVDPRDLERAVRPVLGVEEFNVSPRGCTITGTAGDDRLRGTPARRRDLRPRRRRPDRRRRRRRRDLRRRRRRPPRAAATGDDTLYGDDGDDRCPAATATTCWPAAPGTDRLNGGRGTDTEEQG